MDPLTNKEIWIHLILINLSIDPLISNYWLSDNNTEGSIKYYQLIMNNK